MMKSTPSKRGGGGRIVVETCGVLASNQKGGALGRERKPACVEILRSWTTGDLADRKVRGPSSREK